MTDRIIREWKYQQQQTLRQEEQNTLNLLWQTARATQDANIEAIEARADLTRERKDLLIEREEVLLRLAKRPKFAWSDPNRDPIPANRANLIAFRTVLEAAIAKYDVIEKNGYFYLKNFS